MSHEYTHERIPRRADCLQWTGKNTDAVLSRLTQHKMIGELYRDIHIQVYKGGSYDDTLNIGMWLVIGEDQKLRFYTDDQHALMYRPIDDELERLRAFAREMLDIETMRDMDSDKLELIGRQYGLVVPRAGWRGGFDLAESLKVSE